MMQLHPPGPFYMTSTVNIDAIRRAALTKPFQTFKQQADWAHKWTYISANSVHPLFENKGLTLLLRFQGENCTSFQFFYYVFVLCSCEYLLNITSSQLLFFTLQELYRISAASFVLQKQSIPLDEKENFKRGVILQISLQKQQQQQ